MRRFFAIPSGVAFDATRDRTARIPPPRGYRIHALPHEQLHHRDRPRGRELPVRRKLLLLVRRDRLRVGVTRDLEPLAANARSVAATSASAVLPCGLHLGLAGVEEHVVVELQHHAPVARRHLEVARVDHPLELRLQIVEQLAPLLRLLHRAARLLELGLLVVGHRLRLRHAERRLELRDLLRVGRELLLQLPRPASWRRRPPAAFASYSDLRHSAAERRRARRATARRDAYHAPESTASGAGRSLLRARTQRCSARR